MRKAFLIIISVLLFAGCASSRPKLGMSYHEFDSWVLWRYGNGPTLVKAENDTEVYIIDRKVFYYFKDDKLYKVVKGQLKKNKNILSVTIGKFFGTGTQ